MKFQKLMDLLINNAKPFNQMDLQNPNKIFKTLSQTLTEKYRQREEWTDMNSVTLYLATYV